MWAIGFSDMGGSINVAGSGNQFVSMGGGFDHVGTSSWSTAITGLTPGNTYFLDFMMADENTFTSTPQEITVDFLAGSSTAGQTFAATMLPSSNYWTAWQNQEMAFVATDIGATVQFSATTQYDVGLDDVRVSDTPNVVPEPHGLNWLIGGLAALLAASEFRSRAASRRRGARTPGPSA